MPEHAREACRAPADIREHGGIPLRPVSHRGVLVHRPSTLALARRPGLKSSRAGCAKKPGAMTAPRPFLARQGLGIIRSAPNHFRDAVAYLTTIFPNMPVAA